MKFIIIVLALTSVWAHAEDCYKMSIQVPVDQNVNSDYKLIPTGNQFCISDDGPWTPVQGQELIEQGRIQFQIKNGAEVMASYTMAVRTGDGALGSLYTTYGADKEAVDAEYSSITIVTNSAATDADPNYFGRIVLFGDNKFVLTVK